MYNLRIIITLALFLPTLQSSCWTIKNYQRIGENLNSTNLNVPTVSTVKYLLFYR